MPSPEAAPVPEAPHDPQAPHDPESQVILPERIRDYLAAPRFAVVATIKPDGWPHQAFVWYLLTDEGIVINSRRERQWPRNLIADPRISIAVQDFDEPEEWVGVTGRAEVLHEGDAATEDIMAMARRYGSNPDKYRGQDRVSFLVRPERTFEYR